MATIKDLAAKIGVSKSTVSRVINNDPNVSDETRRKVMNVIAETNYKPNIIARSMIKGVLPIVFIIVGDILNHYFAKIVIGIEKELIEKDYMAVVYNSMYDVEREKKFICMAKEYCPSGIIPMTSLKSSELEEYFENITFPMVLINRELKKKPVDSVFGDDFEASYLSTTELIKIGHTRIAYLSGPSLKTAVSANRERGYRAAMEDHGIEVDESIIFEGKLDIASGYELGKQVLQNPEITAVSSNNFLMALGLYRYGNAIGKDMLSNFDIACNEALPELYEGAGFIYAGADLEAIGAKAAQFLIKRIEKSNEPVQKVIFSATKVYNPKQGQKRQ